ncbi:MAG: hypothetical protein JST28_20725 [Acidobacteria bacterium]|nr:hypothetical protein [Acidobacteriota bacterium]
MKASSNDHPILRVVVSPEGSSDALHLEAALGQIASQKSDINVKTQESSYSLEGRTESELDSICDRLRNEFHLAITVSAPTVILLETICKAAEAEGKYIRQTGGSGNYGHCKLRVEPNEPGKGYEFVNDIKGGVVPKEYIMPIDQGVQSAMELGILAGFQMVDIKVTLFDGSCHDVDSNEMAFRFASSIAFKEAARKASPVLMEPVMAVDLEVPEELAPATRDEIYLHRGQIKSDVATYGWCEIKAEVPLSELLASSSGIATAPMNFAGYRSFRKDDFSDERGSGVTANTPGSPKPNIRSEVTQPEKQDED